MLKEEVDWGVAESCYETGSGEHERWMKVFCRHIPKDV